MLSFHKNYKICQHLNHQYDLNCGERLSCWNEINQQDISKFFIFLLFNFKNNSKSLCVGDM